LVDRIIKFRFGVNINHVLATKDANKHNGTFSGSSCTSQREKS